MKTGHGNQLASPARIMEMLADRFGAFEAIAYAALELEDARQSTPPMDTLTANAILEFADDLEQASEAVIEWSRVHGFGPPPRNRETGPET